MKFVDEFRDPELGRALAGEILSIVEPGRHYKVRCDTPVNTVNTQLVHTPQPVNSAEDTKGV